MFAKHNGNGNEHPRVLTYINSRLTHLHFSLRKDLINHKDIILISFFNYGIICFVINIYLDNQKTALKYLKNTKVNLNNVLIIIENFNIRDNNWDLLYLHHSIYANIFSEFTNVMVCLDTNIFLLSIFLDLIFLFF